MGAYRATATEALEIESHTSPLDLYTESLVARSTLRLQSCTSREAEAQAIRRIDRDGRKGRRRPPKPPLTPGQLRLRWVQGRAGDVTNLETRRPYIRPPWYRPPSMVVDSLKEGAIQRHTGEAQANHLRIYTDGSGIGGRLGAAAVTQGRSLTTTLSHVDDAQVYHAELSSIA